MTYDPERDCYGCGRNNEEVRKDNTPSECEFHPDNGGNVYKPRVIEMTQDIVEVMGCKCH